MAKSNSLDVQRISKAYDLSTDDASFYVSDLRSKIADAYTTNTAKQVAKMYNVSEGAVKYAAKQFGIKKDITKTQFKRAQDYKISKLEETAAESNVVSLNTSKSTLRDYAKAGWTMTKTAIGVAAVGLVMAYGILHTNSANKNSNNTPKQNYSVVQSAGAAEVPTSKDVLLKIDKSADVIMEDLQEIRGDLKVLKYIDEQNNKSVAPVKIVDATVKDVKETKVAVEKKYNASTNASLNKVSVTNSANLVDNSVFLGYGAGYFYGNNGGAANVGISFNYSDKSITPSLLFDSADIGASLALSKSLNDSFELQASVATLGERNAVALGIEKIFNLDSERKTKLGLGVGIFDSFGSKDEGFGGYGSGSLTRKLGKEWAVGVNALVDSQGNIGGGVFLNYGNAEAYNPGIAGQLVANSEKEIKDSSSNTSQGQTQDNNGNNNGNNGDDTPVNPPVNPPVDPPVDPPINPPVVTDPIIFGPGGFDGQ